MPNENSLHPPGARNFKRRDLPQIDKPTIKILLYTDDPSLVVRDTGVPFGLRSMIRHLEGHAPAFANLDVKWESRYPPNSSVAENKINVVLNREAQTGKPFDQVWFFGVHQINKSTFTLGVGGGGPESELDDKEIAELRRQMDGGLGVLITGDHANERPVDALQDPGSTWPDKLRNERFLGLGRALGRCVPRAGELRDWEGSPTANPRHSFNTQSIDFGTNVNKIGFQRDDTPQQLILQTFDETGNAANSGRPHPLFFYQGDEAIQLFPDHPHEGAVTIPKVLDKEVWTNRTSNKFAEPRIVAFGLDKRNGRKLNLIAAYDGSRVGVGRIVADSSWHHYFNVNLEDFQFPADPESPGDQIGQFYANLAVWLTSTSKRQAMAAAMVRWLTAHPVIGEELGGAPAEDIEMVLGTGSSCRRLLARVAAPCEIHELLQLLVKETHREPFETLYFPESPFSMSSLPPKDLLIGSAVHRVRNELIQPLDLRTIGALSTYRAAISTASEMAFAGQKLRLERAAKSAESFFNETLAREINVAKQNELELTSLQTQLITSEGSNIMATCDSVDWEMTLEIDIAGESETFSFEEIVIEAGRIRGIVVGEPGTKLSDLTGTCEPLGAGLPNVSKMTFEFRLSSASGEVGIFLGGVGFQLPLAPKATFLGRFRAYTPDAKTPTKGPGDKIKINPEAGDTGTGTGTQT